MMPFTNEQFFQVFAAYNAAVWPLQIVLVGGAVAALSFGIWPSPRTARWASIIIALLWAWSGVVYHAGFFSRINPAAFLFGGFFVLEAILLTVATRQHRLRLQFRSSVVGWLGAALVVYALAIYPVLGLVLGHAYPAAPTFGAPCPLTIFTFGLLLWNQERTPWYVLVVPILWSAVATSAALSLGVREDLGLPAAAALTLAIIFLRRVRHTPLEIPAVGLKG